MSKETTMLITNIHDVIISITLAGRPASASDTGSRSCPINEVAS
jgi:hypothetical protein